ncbi:hypothetical protein NDU88_000741 [Pleurodeles waltl]|uniref:Uncharacterized protein n=1 Tax=Pleurodeles waltl TaxID=8319 RepID=A0AAV7P5U5_PLEWA|nr:hypothetical protein NDU88_000741 [Pleurodeles waltl]
MAACSSNEVRSFSHNPMGVVTSRDVGPVRARFVTRQRAYYGGSIFLNELVRKPAPAAHTDKTVIRSRSITGSRVVETLARLERGVSLGNGRNMAARFS